jgi:hypothetical protein
MSRIWQALNRDITPPRWNKYLIAYSGAIVGGATFGMTGSWPTAILWDILCVASVWAVLKAVSAI